MTKIHLAIFPLALLIVACATALGSFENVDANRDGGISIDEVQRSEDLIALFNTADDDQDGVLNQEEYALVREVILRSRQSAHSGPPASNSGGGHSH